MTFLRYVMISICDAFLKPKQIVPCFKAKKPKYLETKNGNVMSFFDHRNWFNFDSNYWYFYQILELETMFIILMRDYM